MTLRFAVLLLALATLPAQAQVYKWVDEKGRTHYSNTPPDSVADRMKPVEGRMSVMGMDPAVRAAAEQRFAAMSERDERELHGLGPKYVALATSPGQQQSISPTSYYSHSEGYSPGYGYGYGYAYAPGRFARGARVVHHRSHGGSRGHVHREPRR
jgi:hypothetical protein